MPRLMAQEPIDFDRDVRPIFEEHCWGCHGPSKQVSGLRLDRRDSPLRGGDFGEPALTPGNAETSPLFDYVRNAEHDHAMPPTGEGRRRLTEREITILRDWIDAGAEWGNASHDVAVESQPWSFRPLASQSSHGDIDAFIDATLAAAELQRSPEASAQQLIRRLYFDLIGLPPNYARVQHFVQDYEIDPDRAVSELIDELLASPHYGERWARHWLDVVRFAESDGFEMNHPRPTAWHYRDYCIEAFNRDLPYNQFILQQIAGNTTGDDRATGFLVGGPWDRVKSPDPVLTANQRADELHDMVSVTGSAFLGLTVGCARCHSHKFDPITQIDYYRMKACLSGVQHGERAIQPTTDPEREALALALRIKIDAIDQQLREFEPLASLLPIGTAETNSDGEPSRSFAIRSPVTHRENSDRFAPVLARYVRFEIFATSGAEPCIDELEIFEAEGANVAKKSSVKSSGDFANNLFHRLEHVNDGNYGNEKSWISDSPGRGRLDFDLGTPTQVQRVVWSRDRTPAPRYSDRVATEYAISVSLDGEKWTLVANHLDRAKFGTDPATIPEDGSGMNPAISDSIRSMRRQRKELQAQLSSYTDVPKAYIGLLGTPEEVFRLQRGDPTQPREAIEPGSIESLGGFVLPSSAGDSDRREALAHWIASENNPLTARVMVNRLWHYHFGCGIVDTPSDFGAGGGRPSHPELLDFLAVKLVEQQWSLKSIHRLICKSKTYRQSSTARSADSHRLGMERDSANRWLWHFPARRLEAEPLRDTILAMSDQLNARMGGPGFDLFVANENYVRVFETKTEFVSDDFRRMIYQRKPRAELDQLFGAFDCPDAGQIQPRRNMSTTPLQALNLLNSRFVIDQSHLFAKRLLREAGEDLQSQAQGAFRAAFARDASSEELDISVSLIREHGLDAFCRAVFNSYEFITVY